MSSEEVSGLGGLGFRFDIAGRADKSGGDGADTAHLLRQWRFKPERRVLEGACMPGFVI